LDQEVLRRIVEERRSARSGKYSQADALVEVEHIANVLLLHEAGASIPFIAHYRKDHTGGMAYDEIAEVADRYDELLDIQRRKASYMQTLEPSGALTEELKQKFTDCFDRIDLEDLFLPFRPKRRTRATVARERGLEELAKTVFEQTAQAASLEELAAPLVSAEKQLPDTAAVLQGVAHIIAEWIAEDPQMRIELRQMFVEEGMLVCRRNENEPPVQEQAPPRRGRVRYPRERFEAYYDFSQPASRVPSHRLLTIRRGEKERFLRCSIEINADRALGMLRKRFLKDEASIFAPLLNEAIDDAFKRLLAPALQAEQKGILKQWADREAIRVFADNLRNLLMMSPAGPVSCMGVDPGYRGAFKVAVVDEHGKFAEYATVFTRERKAAAPEATPAEAAAPEAMPAEAAAPEAMPEAAPEAPEPASEPVAAPEQPSAVPPAEPGPQAADAAAVLQPETAAPQAPQLSDVERSIQRLKDLFTKHDVQAVVIGNGTASREADAFLRDFLKTHLPDRKVERVVINEAGANVYASSKVAREEFPRLDPTVRSAISIARRYQDPLQELVKAEPKSIGVGQYQHEVNQSLLRTALERVVMSCVAYVRVNLNTASRSLLRYVAGIDPPTARSIVDYRRIKGGFASREELKNVPRVGEQTYLQAAGLLLVPDAANPLDKTAIHPEAYGLVEKLAADAGCSVAELVGNAEALNKLDWSKYASDTIGPLTLRDIRAELQGPRKDPRKDAKKFQYSEGLSSVEDLKPDMVVEGVVTNVTNFGAFVDIGVHQDGLVHVSQLSRNFVRDPNEVVKVGDVVKVRVLSVEDDSKRIRLSMKSADAVPQKPQRRRRRHAARPAGREQPEQKASAHELLSRKATPEEIARVVQKLSTR
jgi:transcriptional accessory protein Tex/SPT6